jgi:UDP-N-acetylmuramoylalanine-D-glutamate ligase
VRDLEDDGENVWQVNPKTGARIGRLDFQGGGCIIPLVEEKILKTEEDIEKIPMVSAADLLKMAKFQQDITMATVGTHNIYNALAAAASSRALGIDFSAICQGLTAFRSVSGRWRYSPGL